MVRAQGHVDAGAGEHYAVVAMRRLQGKGETWVRIRWQSPESKWMAVAQDKIIYCDGPRDEWRRMFGIGEVPEGVGRLIILLGVGGQAGPQDIAWFDDVKLYKLE